MSDTLGGLLDVALARHRRRPALWHRGVSRTYGELDARSARLATALYTAGLRPGSRVGLFSETCPEALEVYLACARFGLTAVHINDRWAAPEVAAALSGAGVEALVYSAGRAAVVDALGVTGDLRATLGIGGDVAAGSTGYEAALAAAAAVPPRVVPAAPDVAVIGFTSGTSGRPKGVVLSQQALARSTRMTPHTYRLVPYGRCAYTGTFSFVSGLWGIHLPHLFIGARIDLLHPYEPEEWLTHLEEQRSTFTNVSVPISAALAAALERAPERFATLASAIHAGSPMPRHRQEVFVDRLGDRYIEVWGMTEAGGPVTATRWGDWTDPRATDVLASVGHALPTTAVRVLDDDGQATSGAGELVIQADTLFDGYLDEPELTAAAMHDSWYRTGDLGCVDEGGFVYVTGRRSDLIISGGMNVFPAEVESALTTIDGVDDCAVVGVPDDRYGEAVAAAIVVRPGATVSADTVTERLRPLLASYKKPRHVLFVAAIPRNASQKVDRPALQRLFDVNASSRRNHEVRSE